MMEIQRIQTIAKFGFPVVILVLFGFDTSPNNEIDIKLREVIKQNKILPLVHVQKDSPEKVELGRMFFFDPVLSGNLDISCASCHHMTQGTSDGLSLPVGVGAKNPNIIGPGRIKGEGREFVPRNAPDVFNRASTYYQKTPDGELEQVQGFTTMFWDSRLSGTKESGFHTPAGDQTPDGLESALAAQSIFPPTSAAEMRGNPGENQIANIDDQAFTEIWHALVSRIQTYEGYRSFVEKAYPGKTLEDLTIVDVGNAIGAFESNMFSKFDAPWDDYLNGDSQALTKKQKDGAILFYGKAKCSNCHTGGLFTDQKLHNVASPQFSGGKKEDHMPYDTGRMRLTKNEDDFYAFRTPPLRNVAKTQPYMHAGVYATLHEAVKHFSNVTQSLEAYDPTQVTQENLQQSVIGSQDASFVEPVLETLSKDLDTSVTLNDEEVDAIVAFLEALTSSSIDTDMNKMIPNKVPSGLPMFGHVK